MAAKLFSVRQAAAHVCVCVFCESRKVFGSRQNRRCDELEWISWADRQLWIAPSKSRQKRHFPPGSLIKRWLVRCQRGFVRASCQSNRFSVIILIFRDHIRSIRSIDLMIEIRERPNERIVEWHRTRRKNAGESSEKERKTASEKKKRNNVEWVSDFCHSSLRTFFFLFFLSSRTASIFVHNTYVLSFERSKWNRCAHA